MDNKDWFWTLMVPFFVLLLVIAFTYFAQPKSQVVVYDCALSEISADIPQHVKDECRKLRSNK